MGTFPTGSSAKKETKKPPWPVAHMSPHISGIFYGYSLEARQFLLSLSKNQRRKQKNLKTINGPSPISALSNCTAFG